MARRSALRSVVTPYRVFATVALAAAALLGALGFTLSRDEPQTACANGVILHLIPCPGDTDLRQGIIGVSLQGGYKAALVVDRTEIPDDQLRTGGTNQVYFQP